MIVNKRIIWLVSGILVANIIGCNSANSKRSLSLPENVIEDRPIILKEGQAVILMVEGKESLMIGASVVDGKLSVSEIDPAGMSFSVTWVDGNSWETSVVSKGEESTTMILDKTGDGIPDLRVVTDKNSTSRFQLEGPKWIELPSSRPK